MSIMEHLTEKELVAYVTGSLKKRESKDIGKHLLKCADCREALPIPTPQRFLEVLAGGFSERKEEDKEQMSMEKFSLLPLFSNLSSLVSQPQALVLGSTGLVLILSFTFFLWFNSNQSNHTEQEVVASFETKEKDAQFDLQIGKHRKELVHTNEKSNGKSKSSKKTKNKVDTKKELIKSSTNVKKSINSKKKTNKVANSKLIRRKSGSNISSTRGGNQTKSKCDETKSGVSFQEESKKVVFKWKKFPNATKYHLYVSDDDEILIDEYETKTDTTYVLTKSLDPKKNYHWKILVTLENGETIVGMSRKFTVKNFKDNGKLKKKEKKDVRCSEKVELVK